MLALRGVVRPQIDLNNAGATSVSSQSNKSATGYGAGATIVIKLVDDKLFLMASANAGDGLGRYLDSTASGFGAVSNFGLPGMTAANASLNPVSVYGGMIGAKYFITPALRTNVALGDAQLGSPGYTAQFGGCVGSALADGTCSSVNSSMWSGSINLVWSPLKMVDVGLEYQHVERTLHQNAVTGSGSTIGGVENRLQFTAIGLF